MFLRSLTSALYNYNNSNRGWGGGDGGGKVTPQMMLNIICLP